MQIRVKRVYEPYDPDDGERFLVERLWPRGVRRDAFRLRAWLPEVAPSHALRCWYGHDPAEWPEFAARYGDELSRTLEAWAPLLEAARRRPITYSARVTERNSAVALRAFLEAAASGQASPVEQVAALGRDAERAAGIEDERPTG